jgi:competence protein ComEC
MSAMIFLYRYFAVKKKSLPVMFLAIAVGVCVGIVRGQFVTHDEVFLCEKKCEVRGIVTSHVVTRDTYQRFSVEVLSSTSSYQKIEVKSPLYPKVRVGDEVELFGVASKVTTYFSEGDASSFSYEKYKLTKNIGSEMYYPSIEIASSSLSFVMKLKRLREDAVANLEKYIDPPSSSLISGMLLGDTQFSKEERDIFRTSGLSHVVVLSGFNIALVIGVVLFVLRVVPLYLRVAGASLFTFLFIVMVGAEASVVRAALMAYVALLALVVGRGYSGLHALMVSILIFGVWSPDAVLYDVSLHLSFLATVGVVYVREKIITFIGGEMSWYRELFVSSFSAYVMTLPYSMYMFGSASLYALVANMVVLPLVPLLMTAGGLVFILSFSIPYGASVVGFLATMLGDVVFMVARGVASLPFALLQIHSSFVGMIFMYIAILSIVTFLVPKRGQDKNETRETKEGEIWSSVISF